MSNKTITILIVAISLIAGAACGTGVAIKNRNTPSDILAFSGETSYENYLEDVLRSVNKWRYFSYR